MTREKILKLARPILFNTEDVRAILDGRKTVTRRVIKPQPPKIAKISMSDDEARYYDSLFVPHWYPAPYKTSDILYVRETYRVWNEPIGEKTYIYKASSTFKSTIPTGPDIDDFEKIRWHPSIHMPKEAARIFLRVTDVRVERLHDIEKDGLIKEGITPFGDKFGELEYAIAEYSALWDNHIKPKDRYKYGWDANPYVWKIEFERVEVEE